jgi:hypothetical protein
VFIIADLVYMMENNMTLMHIAIVLHFTKNVYQNKYTSEFKILSSHFSLANVETSSFGSKFCAISCSTDKVASPVFFCNNEERISIYFASDVPFGTHLAMDCSSPYKSEASLF